MKAAASLCLAAAAAAAAPALAAVPAPDPRFGVVTHFAQGWDPAWIPRIAEDGITQVRDELYWQSVEPRRGGFVFPAAFDDYMAALRQQRISPLVVLDFANRGYDRGRTPYTEDGFAGYARYAARVLGRYGSEIGAVEIWNEYNGSFCTGPASQHRAATYLRMLRAAYRRIKRVRPDVTVVGGGTSGIPIPYWTELLAGGALDDLDALSVHPYRYNAAPEGLEREIGRLQRLVERYNGGRPKPIWVTEVGWVNQASTAPGVLAIDDATQAKFLVRAYALLLSADVARIYWYDFRDDQGLDMGLVKGDARNTPKPAYVALGNLIAQLRGATFVRREPTPADLYSLVFRRPSGESVRILWSLEPMSVAARGATGVVDLLGRRRPPAGPLRLTDAPIYVTGDLVGLPPPPAVAAALLADSANGFSSIQGANGWSYGTFAGGRPVFRPLPAFSITDWTEAWTGPYPYIAVSAGDQHPSAVAGQAVAAVRRWVSRHAGPVRIAGSFECGTQGDGVGVSIRVDGRCRFRVLLGGGRGRAIVRNFDFVQDVRPGTTIDFAVDPGPGSDIDYDATAVTVSITAPLAPAAGKGAG